jgi:hypothetical protein
MPMYWERQRGESAKAFHAFTHYRNLGPKRSRDAAYVQHVQECGGHRAGTEKAPSKEAPGVWTNWSTRYVWVDRAAEWDAELDRKTREAYEKTLVRVASSRRARQASIALRMQEKALDSIEVLTPGSIEPKDLPRFVETAAKMEREALGLPAETTQTQLTGAGGKPIAVQQVPTKPDLSRMSDEDLEQLEALLGKAQERTDARGEGGS